MQTSEERAFQAEGAALERPRDPPCRFGFEPAGGGCRPKNRLAVSRSWEGRGEALCPGSLQKECSPADNLILAGRGPGRTSDLRNCQVMPCVLFQTTEFHAAVVAVLGNARRAGCGMRESRGGPKVVGLLHEEGGTALTWDVGGGVRRGKDLPRQPAHRHPSTWHGA